MVLALLLAACCRPVEAVRRRTPKTTITFRVRVTKVTPSIPCRIHYRSGGEGLGGKSNRREITKVLPDRPWAPKMGSGDSVGLVDLDDDLEALELAEDTGPKDRIIMKGNTFNYHYLNP